MTGTAEAFASVSTAGAHREAAEHRTVGRVMAILELVLASESQGMRLGQLAASIDAPKSSVHGLAKGLVAIGYFREKDGRYFAGPAISSLIAVGSRELYAVDRHVLEQLSAKWNETAILATLVGDSLVYVDSVHSDQLIRVIPQLNKRLPLWPRSAGKCFLAYLPPKRLNAYFRKNFSDSAEVDAIRTELEEIRASRIAINVGHTVADHIGISSPVITTPNAVTVAIAIVGPRTRMEDRVKEISQSLRETAESLSRPESTA